MASNTATAPDRFNRTLAEVGHLADVWDALSDNLGYHRLVRLKLNYLKSCVCKPDDSIDLQFEQLHKLVELRLDCEFIALSELSALDQTIRRCICGVTSALVKQQGQLVDGLKRLAVWKRELGGLPSWYEHTGIWDDCFQQLVRELIRETEEQLKQSDLDTTLEDTRADMRDSRRPTLYR